MVKRHFNQGKQFSDWLVIRGYDPDLVKENGEIVWHLIRRNQSGNIKDVVTIGKSQSFFFLIFYLFIYLFIIYCKTTYKDKQYTTLLTLLALLTTQYYITFLFTFAHTLTEKKK